MNEKRLLLRILSGSKNIRFNDFVGLVEAFGFRLSRVNGSAITSSHILTCRKW